jgi:hypothetical protein
MTKDAEQAKALRAIVNHRAEECMAAIGREMLRGPQGWKLGDPQDFIRDAIICALRDAGIDVVWYGNN